MKTALIVGVSGQDGAYLSRLLLDKGYRVFGTSRDAAVSSFHNLKYLKIHDRIEKLSMSLNDFRSVIQGITNVCPDEIYNLAGQSSVGLSFEQPVETFESISIGTINLLECLRLLKSNARLYNAGSSECFGDTDGQAADEGTRFHPQSPYATAKAAAHWAISNYRDGYGIYACSGILFNHESPLRPERFVTQKIVKCACRIARGSSETLSLGNIDIQRDWGWAPEYVEAMWRMVQTDEPEDYVIATGATHSLQEFVQAVFEQVGLDWQHHTRSDPDLFRPVDIMVSRARPEKARNKLDWEARYRMPDVARMMVEAELESLARSTSKRQTPR